MDKILLRWIRLSNSDIVLLKIHVEDAEGGNAGDSGGVDTYGALDDINLSIKSHLLIQLLKLYSKQNCYPLVGKTSTTTLDLLSEVMRTNCCQFFCLH